MTASFHTEQTYQHWLDICIAKFEQCFIEDAQLAQALTIRESIATRQGSGQDTNRIRAHNLGIALDAIDAEDTTTFRIADRGRHGNILLNRFGADLLAKLALSPAEILVYEAAFFYSLSDDCYVITTQNRHAPRKFELYVEVGPDAQSLHYSIRGFAETYSGYIRHEQLLAANIICDPSADITTLEAQLSPRLPDLLSLIATMAHRHVDPMVAHSFMQFYQSRLDAYRLDPASQEEIILEKQAFIARANQAITLRIGMKLYQKLQDKLREIFDSIRLADLQYKASPHLVKKQTFSSMEDCIEKINQVADLNQEIQESAGRQTTEYLNAKALLTLKIAEGLPQPLKTVCEKQLQIVTEVEQANDLSLIAFSLTEVLRDTLAKIQEATEQTQIIVHGLTQSLTDFLNNPTVVESWKTAIRPLLRNAHEALTLEEAQAKMRAMQHCQRCIEQLLAQQKQRFCLAKENLKAQLDQHGFSIAHVYRKGCLALEDALTTAELDTVSWRTILTQTDNLEALAEAVQKNKASASSYSAYLASFAIWSNEGQGPSQQKTSGNKNGFH